MYDINRSLVTTINTSIYNINMLVRIDEPPKRNIRQINVNVNCRMLLLRCNVVLTYNFTDILQNFCRTASWRVRSYPLRKNLHHGTGSAWLPYAKDQKTG